MSFYSRASRSAQQAFVASGVAHGLTTKHERLLRLEETARERKLKLTEDHIQALERFSPEFRERHIEVHYPGDLVAVDTSFVGTLKGVGSSSAFTAPCSTSASG